MNVSILIPAYIDTDEKARYLDQCLTSCEKQGTAIVTNDGSPLDLNDIMFAHDCVWLDLPHRGKSYARNAAADAAETDLIYPLDADDWIAGDLSFLTRLWQGTPLYTDIVKWYSEDRKVVHRFSTFHCETALAKCVFSVNVLHSKEQWKEIGGWPEGVQLYEDWMYNVKLLWTFGGEHVATPMVNYRQHAGQSTKTLHSQEGVRLRQVREWALEYAKEHEMGCCGKRRRSTDIASRTVAPPASVPTPTSYGIAQTLPGSLGDGFVEATYVGGKGQGKHIYRGLSTRYPYAVKHGAVIQCDRADACSQEDYRRGQTKSRLVLVTRAPAPPPVPAPIPRPEPAPIKTVEPDEQQIDEMVSQIESMSVKDILANVDSWDAATRAMYLEAEKRGKGRITAIKLLEKE